MTKKTIGFFGDSYCANYPKENNLETYIDMLVKHYDATLVNVGHGGSSIGDAIINQFLPFVKSNFIPNICVFVWTSHVRLFHKTIRTLTYSNVSEYKGNDSVWTAAKSYYENLYDPEFINFQYTAILSHFDNTILAKLPKTTKIVHLWSYGKPKEWELEYFNTDKLEYHYTWKNGIEIRPPLFTIGITKDITTLSGFTEDQGPNHLGNKEKNDMVFNWIRTAIDEQVQEM